MKRFVMAVLGAVLVSLPMPAVSGEVPPTTDRLALDGDALLPPPPSEPSQVSRTTAAITGPGFATFDAGPGYTFRDADAFTIRLVATTEGDVELLRPAVASAALQVASTSGVSLTIAPGTVADVPGDRQPVQGEILLSVDSSSPCGPSAGCGGPYPIRDVPQSGLRIIEGGRAWIDPSALGYTTEQLQHVVAHELGHVFGLLHFDEAFDGRLQMMHSSRFDAGSTYRSGDANGLRFLHPGPITRPPNDAFASAISVTGLSGVTTGSNINASREAGEPTHAGVPGGTSVWYRWTAPATGEAVIETSGSDFDTVLAVYSGGSVSALTVVQSNDDASPPYVHSEVRFPAAAGVTYRIAVDGYLGVTGNLVLRHSLRPASGNEAFVRAAFVDFVDQTPDTSVLQQFTAALDSGAMTRAQLVNGLAASPEWVSTIVQRLYVDTLGREGEPGGAAFWTDEIRSGRRSVAQVAADFYASPEYFLAIGGGTNNSWVRDLYTKLLLRPADDAGVAYWVSETVRAGRTDVAGRFFATLESRNTRVNNLYLALLGRDGEPGGIAFWAGRIATAGDIVLAANLAASEEYFVRARIRFP